MRRSFIGTIFFLLGCKNTKQEGDHYSLGEAVPAIMLHRYHRLFVFPAKTLVIRTTCLRGETTLWIHFKLEFMFTDAKDT